MVIVNPYAHCREEALSSLRKALQLMGYEAEPSLEEPPEGKGDFAFPCFSLAKIGKKNPQEIAQGLAEKIERGEYIEKVESLGPYINFWIDKSKLIRITLSSILESKEEYGALESKGKKIILEHTSANPTDKLHVGRARNPIIGDTLARILRRAGYDVETQYYVDDMGRQAVTLTYGVEGPISIPLTDVDTVEKIKEESIGPYQFGSTVVERFEWAANERDALLNKLELGDEEFTAKVMRITDETMEEKIKPILNRISVDVDNFVHESLFLVETKRIAEQLKNNDLSSKEDGAYYLDLSGFGVNKKFFFLRADGTSLYATRDIAYHLWKAERGDMLINILGEDHKLEARYVKETIKNILKKDIDIESIFYSFVNLPEGRMSTRKGKVVFMDDLLDEAVERAREEVKKRRPELLMEKVDIIAEIVGIGAVRYNIIRVQPEKMMIFKWEEALNFEGNSAPFIQYAHARACSILRKAGIEKIESYDSSLLSHENEFILVKLLAKFPDKIRECSEQRRPHLLAGYAFETASMFNQFYRDCPVLTAEEGLRDARLALVETAKWVLGNVLDCMGISAPEEM